MEYTRVQYEQVSIRDVVCGGGVGDILNMAFRRIATVSHGKYEQHYLHMRALVVIGKRNGWLRLG